MKLIKAFHSTEGPSRVVAVQKIFRKMRLDLTTLPVKTIKLKFGRTVGNLVSVNAEIITGK